MKAVRIHAYGERPSLDDVPDPAITSPLDVIVEVGGAGLCRTDLHIVEGQWAEKSGAQLPYILGHENAGTVVEKGAGVSNVSTGDRVIVHPLMTCGWCRACRSGDDMHCAHSNFPGITIDGGMARYLRTSARSLVLLDDGLEPADVAALADAGLTAYHAARKAAGHLPPDSTVAVIGVGGLGHIGVQALRALTAARIIAIDRSQSALGLAAEVGADETVQADGSEADRVRALTDGLGAEAVLDFVGEGTAVAAGVAMLRQAGTFYVIGYGGRLELPTIDIISREINFVGNLVGKYADLVGLMSLAARGRVRLHTTTYPLSSFETAFSALEAEQVTGRAILVPDPVATTR